MTNQPTADWLVADARRAVHEALIVLPAPEADRVRSLIADLETAVEARTAMRVPAVPVSSPPPSRPEPETPLEKRLRYSERRNDELRTECKRRGKRVLEQSEKIIALEKQLDEVRAQLGAEILRAGQAEAELRRLAAEAQQPDTETQACAHPDGCDGECPCLPSCGCCTVTAARDTEMPNATRAAVYREVADRLTTDAHGMQPDWARIYKRDAAVKVREWADRLDGEGRQDDTTPWPVQHVPGKAVLCPDCRAEGHAICMPDQTLPPPQGPEYTPCECGHIEPEHEATEHAGNPYTGECMECDCGVYRPTPPAPLRRSEDDCPGFPERCPNLRPVDPNPPQHYGGIRCGCHDPQPPAHIGGNADDCPACQTDGLDTIGHPYECPGPDTAA